ncbi:hypothetical protein ACKKBF_B05535 [Auxenochlorella protothecoides x Auxenochlorella symbiontica]
MGRKRQSGRRAPPPASSTPAALKSQPASPCAQSAEPGPSLAGHESFQDWLSNSSTASQSSGGLHVGGPGQPQHAPQGGAPAAASNAAVQSWLKRPPSSAGSVLRWSGEVLGGPLPGAGARPSDGRDSLASSAARLSSARVSVTSSADTVASTYSLAGKGRGSFALERASLESNRGMLDMFAAGPETPPAGDGRGPSAGGTRPSSMGGEAGAQAPAPRAPSLASLTSAWGLAGVHAERCARLAVFAPHSPAPLSVLEKLWETGTAEAGATVAAMALPGVVSVAQAPDGMLWCLPQLDCLLSLQAAMGSAVRAFHRALLASYAREGVTLASLPRHDPYLWLNVGHHLMGAGYDAELRGILLDPAWLEGKLEAAGHTALVADFRRYQQAHADPGVKLVLEALQMSLGLVQAHPEAAGLLRCQLAGRLMVAAGPGGVLEDWRAAQEAALAQVPASPVEGGGVRCLRTLTPSLDQAGGLQRLTLRGHTKAVTQLKLTPTRDDIVSGSADGLVHVWDQEIGDCVLSMQGHIGPITSMCLSADGSLLVSGSADGTARAYEMERGQCLRVLAIEAGAHINAVEMDVSGRTVFTAASDGCVYAWDLSAAAVVRTYRACREDRSEGVLCLALVPSLSGAGRLVTGAADNSARVFDAGSGQTLAAHSRHTSWVVAVAVLPDQDLAVSASNDTTARIWRLSSGDTVHVLAGHTGRINALRLAEGGGRVLTASEDGTAAAWDVASGARLAVYGGHSAWVGDVAPGGRAGLVATASGDGTAVVHSAAGSVLRTLRGHSGAVHAAALTRCGRCVVTASEDGSVRVWDLAAADEPRAHAHATRVTALALQPGGRAASAGADCRVQVWDARTGGAGAALPSWHAAPVRWAAFVRAGAALVTASPDRGVGVWDAATGARLGGLEPGQGSRLKSFAVDAEARRAVTCLWDSTVVVWDLERAQPLHTLQRWGGPSQDLQGHTAAVNEVLITPDGARALSLSKDGTARVWDTSSGACLRVLTGHADSLKGGVLACPPSGPAPGAGQATLLLTHGLDCSLRLWDVDSGALLRLWQLEREVVALAQPRGGVLAAALECGGVWTAAAAPAGPSAWERRWDACGEVGDLALSGDGTKLAAAGPNGVLRLWDVRSATLAGIFVGDAGLTCCQFDSETGVVLVGSDHGAVHFLAGA